MDYSVLGHSRQHTQTDRSPQASTASQPDPDAITLNWMPCPRPWRSITPAQSAALLWLARDAALGRYIPGAKPEWRELPLKVLADRLVVSERTARRTIEALEEHGAIETERRPGLPSRTRLVIRDGHWFRCPIIDVGDIPKGQRAAALVILDYLAILTNAGERPTIELTLLDISAELRMDRNTIATAVKSLTDAGIVTRVQGGHFDGSLWALNYAPRVVGGRSNVLSSRALEKPGRTRERTEPRTQPRTEPRTQPRTSSKHNAMYLKDPTGRLSTREDTYGEDISSYVVDEENEKHSPNPPFTQNASCGKLEVMGDFEKVGKVEERENASRRESENDAVKVNLETASATSAHHREETVDASASQPRGDFSEKRDFGSERLDASASQPRGKTFGSAGSVRGLQTNVGRILEEALYAAGFSRWLRGLDVDPKAVARKVELADRSQAVRLSVVDPVAAARRFIAGIDARSLPEVPTHPDGILARRLIDVDLSGLVDLPDLPDLPVGDDLGLGEPIGGPVEGDPEGDPWENWPMHGDENLSADPVSSSSEQRSTVLAPSAGPEQPREAYSASEREDRYAQHRRLDDLVGGLAAQLGNVEPLSEIERAAIEEENRGLW